MEIAGQWYNQFVRSPIFDASTETQCDGADSIIEFFTDFALSYRGEGPEQWTPDTVNKLCTDLLPRKATAGPQFLEAMRMAPRKFH